MKAAPQLEEPGTGLWKSCGEQCERRGAAPWSKRCLRGKTFVNDTKTINLVTGARELLGTDLTLESLCSLHHVVKHQSHSPPKGSTKLI